MMLPSDEKRAVSASRTVITELMMPHNANFEGKVNAGVILTLMDHAAFTCASRHAGSYCVTVSIDEVEFYQPINVGELVTLMASVNHVGNTSLVVGVKVEAENIKTGDRRHTTTSYFTMVAKDDRGRPIAVPGLLLEDLEDVRRFLEAMYRRETKLKGKVALEAKAKEIDPIADLPKLKRERCEIGFGLDD
jgi:acyl-CoA hydrolase